MVPHHDLEIERNASVLQIGSNVAELCPAWSNVPSLSRDKLYTTILTSLADRRSASDEFDINRPPLFSIRNERLRVMFHDAVDDFWSIGQTPFNEVFPAAGAARLEADPLAFFRFFTPDLGKIGCGKKTLHIMWADDSGRIESALTHKNFETVFRAFVKRMGEALQGDDRFKIFVMTDNVFGKNAVVEAVRKPKPGVFQYFDVLTDVNRGPHSLLSPEPDTAQEASFNDASWAVSGPLSVAPRPAKLTNLNPK